jgi:uncharacterized protein (TIGR02466 family)
MINRSILPLFPTPLYISSINNIKNELEYVTRLEYVPGGPAEIVNCLMTTNNYILRVPELYDLNKNIEEEINIFLRDQLRFSSNIKFNITTSWVTLHRKDHYAQLHNHPNSLYSGVVYLQTDQNSGSITFHERLPTLFPSEIELDIDEYNILNARTWSIQPKTGDLIIFPSYLKHSVEVNKSEQDRFVIAFNIFPSGILGKRTNNELLIA